MTARRTGRAGAKAGHSDPVVLYGRAIAQRTKGTLGITEQKSDAQAQALELQEERDLAIRNRIRELVSESPHITDQAIQHLQTDKKAQILISELQALYGRPLDVEDYRQNKDLRTMVLETIIELNKNAFADIF